MNMEDITARRNEAWRDELRKSMKAKELTLLYVLDKGRNIDTHRATCHTQGLGTVEATTRLQQCLLLGKTLVYLLIAGDTIGCIQLGHYHTRYIGALFGLHTFA